MRWLVLSWTLVSVMAYGQEQLHWLNAELRPYFILDGDYQGQGSLQRMHEMLIAELPELQHQLHWLSLARRQFGLLHGKSNYCAFGMIKNAERQSLKFSEPVSVGTGYSIIVARDSSLHQAWLAAGSPELLSWLVQQSDRIGLLQAGLAVSDFMFELSALQVLTLSYDDIDPIALLAQGRVDFLIEYPARAVYLQRSSGHPEQLLYTHYLSDDQANLSYIACSPATPDALIERINAVIARLWHKEAYQQAMFDWHLQQDAPVLQVLYQQHLLSRQLKSQPDE